MKNLICKLMTNISSSSASIDKLQMMYIIILNCIFALFYVGLAFYVSGLFKSIGIFPSPFWPSAAVAFVAMLFSPRYFSVGIFLGSIIANELVSSPPIVVSTFVSISNVVSAIIGAKFLVAKTKTKLPFFSSIHAIYFILSVILYSALAGFGGVLTGYLFNVIPEHRIIQAWQGWTLSDTIGTIFLSPFLILLFKDYVSQSSSFKDVSILDRLERIIVFVISIVFCSLIFFVINHDSFALLAGVYLIIPPMIWSAIRFSMKDSWLLYIILGSIITVSTLLGYGPFYSLKLAQRLLIIESILFSLSLTLLIVGCLVSERRVASKKLKNINQNLEQLVKERTEELHHQIQFQQHLIDSLPNPLFYKNTQGIFLGCNRAYQNLLKLPKESIVNNQSFQVASNSFQNAEEVVAVSKQLDDYVLTHKKSATPQELKIIDSNSNINHFIFYKNPISDENCNILGLIGVLVDISERKQILLKLQQSEQLFKIVAETAPFAMIMTKANDHSIMYANPTFYQMFKVVHKLKPYQKATEFYANAEDRYRIVEQVMLQNSIKNIEVRLRRDDGVEFWGLLSASLAEYQQELIILVAVHDINQRKLLEEKLRMLATTDSLTGISNRRHFMEVANHLFDKHKNQVFNNQLCALMIDIDFFKRINDNFGHDIGDVAIKTMAQTSLKVLSQDDLFGRLGGEEFAVFLPNKNHLQAIELAEKLRNIIENVIIPIEHDRRLQFTISIGVTQMKNTDQCVDQILSRADKALYLSKNNGRNQSTILN